LSETSCLELQIARAYMRLPFVSQRGDGARTISLGRFGNCEVFLVELPHADSTRLWIELYDHTLQQALDSCGCTDIEEAAAAARLLIPRARQLSHEI
jgi:hypothetical protein